MVPHRAAEGSRGTLERGFTLIEIMLAVTLLSIIVTVMYSAFHTMGRIVRRTEETKGAYQTARLIMSRMRQDLACAYFSPTRSNFIFRGEDIPDVERDADALTFVTTAHVVSGRDVPEGDLAEVSYYLDEDNRGILVRREDVSPDDELEVGGVLDILGKDVVGLNFTYLDGRAESQGSERDTNLGTVAPGSEDIRDMEREGWKEEWDSDETAYLPRAVRIDLSVLNEEGEVEDFSATVVLAMGRSQTSIDPRRQDTLGITQASPTRTPSRGGRTQPSGIRPSGSGERGGREGFRPGRGDRSGRGRGGPSRPSGSGTRSPQSGRTPTSGNVPNATPGTRPPTPGGRR